MIFLFSVSGMLTISDFINILLSYYKSPMVSMHHEEDGWFNLQLKENLLGIVYMLANISSVVVPAKIEVSF